MQRVAWSGDAQAGAGQARSHVVVDLVTRGQTLGRITVATSRLGRRFAPLDVELAQDLARRTALAVDNTRLFHEAQEQAEHQAVLNAALRESVQERDQAVSDLQRALQTRDEFLASASHDLKNPLASIKASVQLLQRRLDRPEGADPNRIREGLQRLDSTVTRAAGLVEELLGLTFAPHTARRRLMRKSWSHPPVSSRVPFRPPHRADRLMGYSSLCRCHTGSARSHPSTSKPLIATP